MTTTCTSFRAIGIRVALLAAVLPGIAAAQLKHVGPEFQVNSHTTSVESNGYGPRLGVAADGSFVVSWVDDEDDSVRARLFTAPGSPVAPDFEVAPPSSYRPAMTVLPDGHFVVAWEGPDGSAFSNYGILAQRFSSAGSAVGALLQINTYTIDDQNYPWAATDGAGNILIAWESRLQDGNNRGIFAQRFDSGGTALGSEFQVNGYTFGSQATPFVAGDPAGGFVVTWSDYRYNGFLPTIQARRYDSAGDLIGGEFQVNAYTSCGLGNPPALDIGPGGGIVAAFSCNGRDGDTAGVFARRFTSSGAPAGTEFQVSTQTIYRQFQPAVAHDENDGFTIVWAGDAGDYFSDVRGRRFDSTGAPSGGDFRISTYTPFNQNYPRIAALADGEFLVVWASDHQDGISTGVFGQHLAPVGTAIGGKKLLIKTPPSGPAKNKLVLLSKDAAIAPPSSVEGDPRCTPLGSGAIASGGRLKVDGPGGNFAIDLPCAGWSADTDRTKFTYKDATGATCKIVKIKQGKLLKAVCAGAQVAYTLGAAQDEVRVSLRTGNPESVGEHCLLFSAGTGADIVNDGTNGRSYKALAAAAPNFCP